MAHVTQTPRWHRCTPCNKGLLPELLNLALEERDKREERNRRNCSQHPLPCINPCGTARRRSDGAARSLQDLQLCTQTQGNAGCRDRNTGVPQHPKCRPAASTARRKAHRSAWDGDTQPSACYHPKATAPKRRPGPASPQHMWSTPSWGCEGPQSLQQRGTARKRRLMEEGLRWVLRPQSLAHPSFKVEESTVTPPRTHRGAEILSPCPPRAQSSPSPTQLPSPAHHRPFLPVTKSQTNPSVPSRSTKPSPNQHTQHHRCWAEPAVPSAEPKPPHHERGEHSTEPTALGGAKSGCTDGAHGAHLRESAAGGGGYSHRRDQDPMGDPATPLVEPRIPLVSLGPH